MAENIRSKVEEMRTRILSRVEEIRGGGSSPGHSPLLGNLGIMKGPLAADIREKGLIVAARERLGKLTGPAPAPSPPAEEVARPEFVTPEQWARLPRETKEALAEGSGVKYEAARESLKWVGVEMLTPGKVQRGRVAIEGS